MKICPTCHQTFNDASLNFCLTDGSVLTGTGRGQSGEPTVLMTPPSITNQFQTFLTNNFKEGVTGVYAGDAIPIAFSNLQLNK